MSIQSLPLRRVDHFAALLALAMASCLTPAAADSACAQEKPAAPVAVATVRQQKVASGRTFLGTLTPIRRTVIGSAVAGRVEKVHVDEGDPIGLVAEADASGGPSVPGRGQPLVQLRTKTAAIQVAAARASLKLREEELRELQTGARPEEVAAAKARQEAAKATKEFAEANFVRARSLFQQKSISKEEFDDARTRRDAAVQQFLAAKADYDLVEAGPREERVAQAVAQVAVAREQLNALEDRMAKFTIRAPFPGYVVAKHTEVGAWIKEGEAVVEVVSLDPIEVRLAVPESVVSLLKVGMTARIRIEALPERVIVEKIHRIVPVADPRSRTFPVRIRVPNPRQSGEHLLKAGMLVQVTLAVGKPGTGLMVPKDALVLGGPSPTVFVVAAGSEGDVVRPVPVELGVANGSWIEVRGPLKANQQVVVRGNERLRPDQPIRIIK